MNQLRWLTSLMKYMLNCSQTIPAHSPMVKKHTGLKTAEMATCSQNRNTYGAELVHQEMICLLNILANMHPKLRSFTAMT